MIIGTPQRACRVSQALAFAARVHDKQKIEGLWLAQQPFVHAVRSGWATPEDLARWVRQVYCTTATYGEVLRSMCPPPPVGLWTDPWRDMEQLIELAGALGVGPVEMERLATNPATRAVQVWLRQNLTDPSRHIPAQVCWALVEAMSPETGTHLDGGAAKHLGVKAKHLGYFRIGMRSRRSADRYAANLLTRIAMKEWCVVQEKTLLLSRLMIQLYDSIGARCPSHLTGRFGKAGSRSPRNRPALAAVTVAVGSLYA
jgi:hypothetical protein